MFFNTIRLAFYFIRCLQHYSLWMSERARNTVSFNGADTTLTSNGDFMYALKMHLNLNPVGFIIISFTLMQLVFTILFYLSEVGLRKSGQYNRFEKISNSAWLTTQILLSAGSSGQEVPMTNLGHIISLFCSIGGTLIIALLIICLRNTIKFTPYEEELYKRTKEKQKHLQNDPLRTEANLVIKNFIHLRFLRKFNRVKNMPLRAKLSMELVSCMSRFHALRMKTVPREARPDIKLSKFHSTLQISAKQIDKGL